MIRLSYLLLDQVFHLFSCFFFMKQKDIDKNKQKLVGLLKLKHTSQYTTTNVLKQTLKTAALTTITIFVVYYPGFSLVTLPFVGGTKSALYPADFP